MEIFVLHPSKHYSIQAKYRSIAEQCQTGKCCSVAEVVAKVLCQLPSTIVGNGSSMSLVTLITTNTFSAL
jgi:hypothetical protein